MPFQIPSPLHSATASVSSGPSTAAAAAGGGGNQNQYLNADGSARKRRPRTNQQQLEVLDEIYDIDNTPCSTYRTLLSSLLGLSSRSIQVFFQNKRQKYKLSNDPALLEKLKARNLEVKAILNEGFQEYIHLLDRSKEQQDLLERMSKEAKISVINVSIWFQSCMKIRDAATTALAKNAGHVKIGKAKLPLAPPPAKAVTSLKIDTTSQATISQSSANFTGEMYFSSTSDTVESQGNYIANESTDPFHLSQNSYLLAQQLHLQQQQQLQQAQIQSYMNNSLQPENGNCLNFGFTSTSNPSPLLTTSLGSSKVSLSASQLMALNSPLSPPSQQEQEHLQAYPISAFSAELSGSTYFQPHSRNESSNASIAASSPVFSHASFDQNSLQSQLYPPMISMSSFEMPGQHQDQHVSLDVLSAMDDFSLGVPVEVEPSCNPSNIWGGLYNHYQSFQSNQNREGLSAMLGTSEMSADELLSEFMF